MSTNTAAAFGRILRLRRTAKGISQEELASRAGLHRTFVSMLERGTRAPSLDAIRKLAVGLETTAADLVEDAEAEIAVEEHGATE